MAVSMRAYDGLAALGAELLPALENTRSYRRFRFEQARLNRLCAHALQSGGSLTSSELTRLSRAVDRLGLELLAELSALRGGGEGR